MRKSYASIYTSCPKQPLYKDLSSPEMKLSNISVDFEGRSVHQSTYIVDNPRDRYKGLKPSDFSLENQLAVGVPQKLAQYSPSIASIDSEITRVNNLNMESLNDGKK